MNDLNENTDINAAVNEADSSIDEGKVRPPSRKRYRSILAVSLTIIVVLAIVAGGVIYYWYNASLKPVSAKQSRVRVKISPGMSAKSIGDKLQDSKVIRNSTAFSWYTRTSGLRSKLQAGTYLLSPSQSTQEITSMLATGKTNVFNIVILPGQTLDKIKEQLISDGFDESEIDRAMTKSYSSKLFAGKPKNASLEGYIFPDTYQIDDDTSVEMLLQKIFDNFWAKIQDKQLMSGIRAHKLNMFQAVTLASIVEKEDSNSTTQPQIAQVFYSRLNQNISLGSDVTALYGATLDGLNLPSDSAEAANIAVRHDSPYNTRIHRGLPPGPVSNFDISALQAVANPARGNYLYFVAGDDGKVHFSRTESEHEQNITKYCNKLCK